MLLEVTWGHFIDALDTDEFWELRQCVGLGKSWMVDTAAAMVVMKTTSFELLWLSGALALLDALELGKQPAFGIGFETGHQTHC